MKTLKQAFLVLVKKYKPRISGRFIFGFNLLDIDARVIHTKECSLSVFFCELFLRSGNYPENRASIVIFRGIIPSGSILKDPVLEIEDVLCYVYKSMDNESTIDWCSKSEILTFSLKDTPTNPRGSLSQREEIIVSRIIGKLQKQLSNERKGIMHFFKRLF